MLFLNNIFNDADHRHCLLLHQTQMLPAVIPMEATATVSGGFLLIIIYGVTGRARHTEASLPDLIP